MIDRLVEHSKTLGFLALGLCRPQPPPFLREFRAWIDSGKHADMHWLSRRSDLRENPERLLTGVRSVITLAYPYGKAQASTPEGLTVARYAEPEKEDYHHRLKALAGRLAEDIRSSHPGSRSRVCVDSAPILERAFAYRSGIGFIGKNNMLIIPGHGSYFFLAEILTTAELSPTEARPMENQCGACDRCLEACPTGALEAPFSLNAGRCLSYLTIESDRPLERETGLKMRDCFLGCDGCQEACPFNGEPCPPRVSVPGAGEILQMEESAFQERFGRTALARPGLGRIRRNLLAVLSQARCAAVRPSSKA
jgi:epoxyqueuosine reductase